MSVYDYRDYRKRDRYLLKTMDGGLSWEKVTTITGVYLIILQLPRMEIFLFAEVLL